MNDPKKNAEAVRAASLPCPWCGELPSVDENDLGMIQVTCSPRSACRVSPSTGWCDSAGEALAVWNRRE